MAADRMAMLKEINEVSFAADDLRLYLDTHPTESEALDLFEAKMKRRRELLSEYAKDYEPLTADCVCPDTDNRTGFATDYPDRRHFTWADGPLPWEGGAV